MANIIEAPTTTDILFGRDSDSWNHEGNRRFRIVVAKYQDEYHSTNARAKKVAIVAKIVEELKSGGCRFLKKNPQNSKWFEVDRKAAVEKVGHAIRDKQVIAQRKLQKMRPIDDDQSQLRKGGDDGSHFYSPSDDRRRMPEPYSNTFSQPILHAILARQQLAEEQRQQSFLAATGANSQARSSVLPELLLAQHLAEKSELDLLARSRAAQMHQARELLSSREAFAAEALLSRRRSAGSDSLSDVRTTMLLERVQQQAAVAEEFAASRQRRSLLASMMGNQSSNLDILRAGMLARGLDSSIGPTLGLLNARPPLVRRSQSLVLPQSSITIDSLSQDESVARAVARSPSATDDSPRPAARPPKKRLPAASRSMSLPPKYDR